MGFKQTLRAIPKDTAVAVVSQAVLGCAITGWAVMGEVSWPVAIVLGLAAVYVVIALVNVYKKSEWPFRQNLEKAVKDSIEHANYKHQRLVPTPWYLLNYEIEVGGLRANIFQVPTADSIVFVTADWKGPDLFDNWPEDARQSFICDIIPELFRMRLEHQVHRKVDNKGEWGFSIKAPIFCDRKSISNEVLYERVLSVISMIRLMQLKWLHGGAKFVADSE